MVASSLIFGMLGILCPRQSVGVSVTVRSEEISMALRGQIQSNNATLPDRLRKLGSSVRQMAEDSHNPIRFEVVLDRSKGGANGIATAWLKGQGGTHCITSIDEQGLASAWNKANPAQALMKDDCIIEVNGVRGDADAVLKELKQKKVLRIKLQRGGMFMRPEEEESTKKSPKPLVRRVSTETYKDINGTKSATLESSKKMAPAQPKTFERHMDETPMQPMTQGRLVNTTTAAKDSGRSANTTTADKKGTRTANTGAQVSQANVTQVMDAALRAAHRADTIAKEMSTTWTSYPPEYQVGNPGCFNHTGRKCDELHTCGPWSHCSKGWCVCASWGCGDSYGACRAASNEWLAMDLRIAPAEDPHKFLAMPTDEGSGPYVLSGWPESANQEALWDLLVQPDNVSVLIATKWGRDHWHGRFVDLNETSGWFEPTQRLPYDALQAAWNLIVMPQSRLAFRHARTGLYLKYEQGKLSTCASPDCPATTADFDVWPRIENDQEPCDDCESPYYLPKLGVKGRLPWFLNPREGWGTRSVPKHAQAPDRPWYLEEH